MCSASVVYHLRFIGFAVSCLSLNQLCPEWVPCLSLYSYVRNSMCSYLSVSGFLTQYPRSSGSLFQWASFDTCVGRSLEFLVWTAWYVLYWSPKLNGKAASLVCRRSLTYVTLLRALRPDVGGWVTLSPRYWTGVPSDADGGRAPYSAVLDEDLSWSSKLAYCLSQQCKRICAKAETCQRRVT